MDKYSSRFLWLATQMLGDCVLDDPAEQAELDKIVGRLREMSVGLAGDVSCRRMTREIDSSGQGRRR